MGSFLGCTAMLVEQALINKNMMHKTWIDMLTLNARTSSRPRLRLMSPAEAARGAYDAF